MKATLVLDITSHRNIPGAIEYFVFGDELATARPAGMHFVCPCGCGKIGGVTFRQFHGNGPVWNWNDNREKPTVYPSINFDAGHWHGFLTNGEWEGQIP